MFTLLPQLYPQDFVDFFIHNYFQFLDNAFHKWLDNFDIEFFHSIINNLDHDLTFIFKACVRHFSLFFIFNQTIALQKIWKMLFISSKKLFRSRDIQIFVFPSSPFFFPVTHCFRGWSKIDLIVCDIINCLKKNLITHFVSYLGKEKGYDIETFPVDRVLNKKHLYGKIMQKMSTKS